MPPKKRAPKTCAYSLACPIQYGFSLSDAHKRIWTLGKSIGQGGFGCIYAASLHDDKHEEYVAKIEPQENGPLFTEIHFYIRACSTNSIAKWLENHHSRFLGIPRYVSSGLCTPPNQKPCRFLIMDRYAGDLENALKNGKVNAGQIVIAATHVLDALEYIHSKDYAHADVKASNLLYKNSPQEVTLVDFGLVHLFRIRGVHCSAKPDPKFRHNGTLEFCSRDAHQARAPSRRGDLEILAYNLVHWLARTHLHSPQTHTTGLPWGHLISDPKLRENVPERIRLQVAELKEAAAKDPSSLLSHANLAGAKTFLTFLQSILQLGYDETPNYSRLRNNLSEIHRNLSSMVIAKNSSSSRSRKPASKRSSTEILPETAEKKLHVEPTHDEMKRTPRKVVQSPHKPSSNRKPVATVGSGSKQIKVASPTVRTTALKRTPNDKSSPLVTKTQQSTERTPKTKAARSRQLESTIKLYPTPTTNQHSKLSSPFSDDSEDDFDKLIRSAPRTAATSPRVAGSRKVLAPLTPQTAAALPTRVGSTKVTTISPPPPPPPAKNGVVRSRKSGCCQTSPDLLLIAKAEALRHRALRLKSQRF